AEMIAAGERTGLAEDHLDRIQSGRAFIHQPSARQRGAPAAVHRLGVTEIDGVILGKAAVEHDVVQAALTRREDFRHAAERGRERAILGDDAHAPGPLGDQHAAGGQERERPGMIKALRYGLHHDVASGGMENLRAGGRAADRNHPDCAHSRTPPVAAPRGCPSHGNVPARLACARCDASMLRVDLLRFGATTMRRRRCSGKFRAVHIGVTALLTFPLARPVSSSAAKFPEETARTSMKMSAIAAAIAVAVGGGGGAHAQGYPSHPITMIVPFPAGGPTDTLARVLGERMRVSLGQPVIIETVTGAGASIGVARAAQAAPDGYPLSIGNGTSHVGAGAMYPAAHDAVLELQPVSRISATPLMIIGKNALASKNARELIAWLKANPGKASAATVGAGSAAHICLLYFQQKTGTNFQLVPYRGGAPVRQDLVAGQIDMFCAEA